MTQGGTEVTKIKVNDLELVGMAGRQKINLNNPFCKCWHQEKKLDRDGSVNVANNYYCKMVIRHARGGT
jgi:hypothetical protein